MSEKVQRGNTIRNRDKEKKNAPENARQLKINFNWDKITNSPRSSLIIGVFFIILSFFLELSFISYLFTGYEDQSVVSNIGSIPLQEIGRYTNNFFGILGAVVAHIFVYRWFGIAAMLLPIIAFLAGTKLAFKKELFPLATATKVLTFFTLFISVLAGYFVSIASKFDIPLSYLSGGFGFVVNQLLDNLLGYASILPILFSLFTFLVIFFNIKSFDKLVALFSRPEKEITPEPSVQQRTNNLFANEEEEDVIEDEAKETIITEEIADRGHYNVKEETYDEPVVVAEKDSPKPQNTFRNHDEDALSEIVHTNTPIAPIVASTLPSTPAITPHHPTTDDFEDAPPSVGPSAKKDPYTLEIEVNTDPTPLVPLVVESPVQSLSEQLVSEFGQYDSTIDLPTYMYPGVDLLAPVQESSTEKVSQDELEGNKVRIVETLGSYGINISKIKATIGPTVTLYEIIPEAGVRISKIKNLEGDIALSLSAMGIRIIAPMPGRGTIGIEVPNKNRETVFIRSVMSNERFTKSNYELPVVLGKTISNEIYVGDLAKMPHLLMAGATGQGKSVGLNVILTSLIYKKHPSQLKFVLVDPKKVELTLFNKLERHFLAKLPNSEEAIITDTKKVIYTLNSLCIEMDSRYDLLKDAAVKNIKEYNAKFTQRKLNPQNGHHFLPYIVLVIDELADLMMTAGKEVETPIARLAQLARAVGIHLVVATQRPSVKVITGLIKANFPARLSYRVTSSIDSRTILDAGGAEQLVGQGDMLLSINSDIIRLQCPFIDTGEIEEICQFIGDQRGYSQAYALPEFEGDDGGDGKGELDVSDFDNLLPEAAKLIVTHQQGSTSLIQRKMKLGYNRAGRIMDQLEAIGVVGPFTGSKPREVLFVDIDQLLTHLRGLGIE